MKLEINIKYQTGEAYRVIIPDEAFQNTVGCLLDDDSVFAERTGKNDRA